MGKVALRVDKVRWEQWHVVRSAFESEWYVDFVHGLLDH